MKNMDDSPKILAVSYGNFSCRLEGFDDSVETMKAVVSYFHELAGHERFMDMDPQAPDMGTLARLTEEQVGAPVEATGEGNSVSLRMAEEHSDAAEEDDLDLTAEDFAEEFDAPLADDADEEDVIAEEEIAETLVDEHDTIVLKSDDSLSDADDLEEDAPEAEAPEESDSVAARLQRIRAVVDNGASAASAEVAEDDDPEEDTPAPAPAAGVNPLAQRLADLAKRNAERAAEEAGVTLDFEEDEDDVSAEELAELDAEFADEDDEVFAEAAEEVAEYDETQDEDIDDRVLQLAPEDRAEEAPSDEDADGPLVLTASEEVPSRGGDYGDFDLKEEVAEAQREIEEILEEKEERSKHDDVLDNVDRSMTRIMSQTDERLNEPEGRRHRDAFAQLKAAVAATEAARQLGDPGGQTRDKNEVFREDLGALDAEDAEAHSDDAAMPDAPAADLGDTDIADTAETPDIAEEDAAPAPLKLVSSQIVEPASTTLDAASARLRQIAAQKDGGAAAKGGFAEFAAQQGATELGDLLEAAAAYIAFVEGDEDFSRPQVMKKVQAASPNEFTREDGLRSFGRLLRQSRIIKLNNGRFQVADDTRFRPGDQAAQG